MGVGRPARVEPRNAISRNPGSWVSPPTSGSLCTIASRQVSPNGSNLVVMFHLYFFHLFFRLFSLSHVSRASAQVPDERKAVDLSSHLPGSGTGMGLVRRSRRGAGRELVPSFEVTSGLGGPSS